MIKRMLCDNCRQKEATVHIVQMADGEKSEINLCEDCAREKKEIAFSFEPQFSLHKLFSSLIDQKLRSSREAALATRLQCPGCGLTFAQFGQVGRLGCSCCIDTFGGKLNSLLARIHAGPLHTGKIPASLRSRIILRRELKKLQEELQAKVVDEEFEEAALLRDRIRTMKKEIAAEEEPAQPGDGSRVAGGDGEEPCPQRPDDDPAAESKESGPGETKGEEN